MNSPDKIFYEPAALDYKLGQQLHSRFTDIPWIEIDSHNNIPELRANPNSAFPKMKKYVVIGIRKTHRYVENHKVSDFLVPYTSSGCSASCLYCYLVCNYNKCSYLRIFVNREQMMERMIKIAQKTDKELCFEIGSNSDLILENTITENLPWTIENFGKSGKGKITFPTKFDMVDPLLHLNHKERTIFRMSVNPEMVIRKVEFGTSPLFNRIHAVNLMSEAGYPVGILLAPIILLDDWKHLYAELINQLAEKLSPRVKKTAFIEIIFMTYSYVNNVINQDAFPNSVSLYDTSLMTGRGRGKYCYRDAIRADGEVFLRTELAKKLPEMKILYVV